MKKSIAILFVLLLIAGAAYARMTVIGIAGMVAVSGNECDGYIVCENFEGTGAPTGFATYVGSPNYDYTTTVLRGTKSLSLSGNGVTGDITRVSFDEITGSTHVFFRFQTNDFTGTHNPLRLYNGSTSVLYIRTYSGGTTRLYYDDGASFVELSALVDNTTYYFWVEYTPASADPGADGVVTIYRSETRTKPETPDVAPVTIATSTLGIEMAQFACEDNTGAVTVIIDQVLVDDSTIGSVPE